MSFSSEVKRELTSLEVSSNEEYPILLGLLLNSAQVNISKIANKLDVSLVLRSQIPAVISFASNYFKKHYDVEDILKTNILPGIKQARYYYLEIHGDNCKQIVDDFHLFNYQYSALTDQFLNIKNMDESRLFVRGLFLAHGSISDPVASRYHFEITTTNFDLAVYTKNTFAKANIKAAIREKTYKFADSRYTIYIKKSEDISQALTFIGAINGMFNYEDQRIRRDFLNNANRVTNCDMANEKKCSVTAMRQIDAINYLKEHKQFNNLPMRLKMIAELRLAYPVASNNDLSYYSEINWDRPLSKSGISHCLNDLLAYFEAVKRKEETNKK